MPTEAALAAMRASTPPVRYLVGTPKARLNRMEAALAERPWVEVRGQLRVKCVAEDGEVYVLTESPARVDKERAMRRRALKKYWKRFGELSRLKSPTRDELLVKLGQASGGAGALPCASAKRRGCSAVMASPSCAVALGRRRHARN